MVKGISRFREYFTELNDHYALIGGTACYILFEESGLNFRATKDLDVVLLSENINENFARKLAKFLNDGGYQYRERSTRKRELYRFHRPLDNSCPAMIELFARRPDSKLLPDDVVVSPIPVENEVTSLSAILMDEDYFNALKTTCRTIDKICVVEEKILLVLKAHAYLSLKKLKEDGGTKVKKEDIKKHRNDIFRLVQLLPRNGSISLGKPIRDHLREFIDNVQLDDEFNYNDLRLPVTKEEAVKILKEFYLIK